MSRLPRTDQSLTRHLRQQKRAMVRQANGSPYSLSGTRVSAEDEVTVDGRFIVNGPLDVTGDADVTGDLSTSGTTALGGNVSVTGLMTLLSDMVVNGLIRSQNFVAGVSGWRLTSTGLEVNTLTAKDAIIGDQALANPVSGDVGNAYVLTPVTTSWGSYAGVTINIPAGFSRAQVMAVGSTIGPTSDTWQIRINIAGVTGAEYTIFGNNGALGYARNLTGLSGGSFTVYTEVRNAIASGNNRGIATSVTVVFLK